MSAAPPPHHPQGTVSTRTPVYQDHAHLGGRPVDPAFAVGVNVHQHQPLHQVGEDELRGEGDRVWEAEGCGGSLSSHSGSRCLPCLCRRWLGAPRRRVTDDSGPSRTPAWAPLPGLPCLRSLLILLLPSSPPLTFHNSLTDLESMSVALFSTPFSKSLTMLLM